MTELEKKAEENICNKYCGYAKGRNYKHCQGCYRVHDFIKGYEQGQKGKNYFNKFVEVSEENKKLQKENEELKAEISKLKDELKNNANCLNCVLYGSPYCKRKDNRVAPCKKWKSENSKIYEVSCITGRRID